MSGLNLCLGDPASFLGSFISPTQSRAKEQCNKGNRRRLHAGKEEARAWERVYRRYPENWVLMAIG